MSIVWLSCDLLLPCCHLQKLLDSWQVVVKAAAWEPWRAWSNSPVTQCTQVPAVQCNPKGFADPHLAALWKALPYSSAVQVPAEPILTAQAALAASTELGHPQVCSAFQGLLKMSAVVRQVCTSLSYRSSPLDRAAWAFLWSHLRSSTLSHKGTRCCMHLRQFCAALLTDALCESSHTEWGQGDCSLRIASLCGVASCMHLLN